MPGIRGAERVEIKPGEIKTPEAKDIEIKVQPFLLPVNPSVGKIPLHQGANGEGVKSFIEIGENNVGLDPQFRPDRVHYDRITLPDSSIYRVEVPAKRFAEPVKSDRKTERRVASPELVGFAAGVTAFFGFIGEVFAGPATDIVLKGKEASPARVREGMPEGNTPIDLSKARDHLGGSEVGMLLGLTFALSLPFLVGKARRAWRRHQVKKYPERLEKLNEKLAASMHETEGWRHSMQIDSVKKPGFREILKGILLSYHLIKFSPRIRVTTDAEWIAAHPEIVGEIRDGSIVAEIDVANMKYKDLPSDLRAEYRLLADAAMGEVLKAVENKVKPDDAFIDAASEALYLKSLEQDTTSSSGGRKSYQEISEAEKERFNRIVGEAIGIWVKSGLKYPIN
jgi:hypothetical protein